MRTLSVPTTASTLFFEAHSGSARPTPTLEAKGPCGMSSDVDSSPNAVAWEASACAVWHVIFGVKRERDLCFAVK